MIPSEILINLQCRPFTVSNQLDAKLYGAAVLAYSFLSQDYGNILLD